MANATITKSAEAPDGLDSFAVANSAFEFNGGTSIETEDAAAIAFAQESPYFDVTLPEVKRTDAETEVNPLTLPSADHLSGEASDESKKAAAENEANIRKAVDDSQEQPEGVGEYPSLAEQQKETFSTIGVDAEPVSPVADTAPVEAAPAKTQPATPATPAQPTDPSAAAASTSAADSTTTGSSSN